MLKDRATAWENQLMPRRSNEFQRLIYAIRINLADGAKVTESKLLRDRLTKGLREVDVCIESSVGGTPVRVCVECRDHARPADVGWVDAMKEKHSRLPTNALILASRKGFTPEARRAATLYDMETVALDDIDEERFPAMFGIGSSLWQKETTISVEQIRVKVPATEELDAETVICSPDNNVFDANGNLLGYVSEVVAKLVQQQYVHDHLVARATPEHKAFELIWEPPRDSLGRPFFIQKIDPSVFREILAMNIRGPVTCSISTFGVRRHSFGDVKVLWAPTQIMGNPALFVATRDAEGKDLLALHVAGSSVSPSTLTASQHTT
ncbi:MAG: hypothetical protein KKC85_04900 [Gammaproteobacteria bacterium]|nr:hypothetical protein [Gammaproteobacteria bacterium]MBU1530538.1 hypothetical protein [Gammaproteobacteria bacterium]MBU2285755.1 hypothetical protein [Gammaproteobacteria bacterium]